MGPQGDAGPLGPQGLQGPAGSITNLDDALADTIVGPVDPVASGSTTTNSNAWFWPDQAQYNSYATFFELALSGAQTVSLLVCSLNGDGTLDLVSSTDFALEAGVNTLQPDGVYVPKGCIVGVRATGGKFKYTTGHSGSVVTWYMSGIPSTNTSKAVAAGLAIHFRVTIRQETAGEASQALTKANGLLGTLGSVQLVGPALGDTFNGNTTANRTWIYSVPVSKTGRIVRFSCVAASAHTGNIVVVSLNGDGTVDLVSSTDVSLQSGENKFAVNIDVEAGQYVGIGAPTVIKYASGSTLPVWAITGLPGTNTAKTVDGTWRYAMQFEMQTGLLGDITTLNAGLGEGHGDGLALLADADETGATDATEAFLSARQSHPHPYVRPGSFFVTNLPSEGGGFWGSGRILLDGERFFIPSQPSQTNLYSGLRAAMADIISDASPIILIGDSISHFAYASTQEKHWFNRLTRFANSGIAQDEPIMTALRPSGGYDPSFYGVTTTGVVSTGTKGPLDESLILSAGAALSFTGAFDYVDVFYTQESGAGSLAFDFNGGASFKTVDANGTAELDKTSYPSATGQSASGTYTITASGGSVEITGLIRLGVKAASTPPRLYTQRCGHGSFTFASLGAVRVTSMLKQATFAGGSTPRIILALGINDSFSIDPATIVTNATALIDNLEAGGVKHIHAVLPIRPSSGWNGSYTGGRTYEGMLGPLMTLYNDRGVDIIPAHALDWVSEGLTQDGLHPNDAGNERLAQIVVERLGD